VSKFDPDKLQFDPTKPVTADKDGLYTFPQPDGTVITARRVDWRAERERAPTEFDPAKLQLNPEQLAKARAAKGRRKQKSYAQLAMSLGRHLAGASGQTYATMWMLVYQHWKGKGGPVRLTNRWLADYGVTRIGKHRALKDLAQRGLVVVDSRPHRSPLVTLTPAALGED
jgi:hypothetical protein